LQRFNALIHGRHPGNNIDYGPVVFDRKERRKEKHDGSRGKKGTTKAEVTPYSDLIPLFLV
jgi:hypothetical protein